MDNSTSSTFHPDPRNQIDSITHSLNGTTRTFAYGYDSVGNREWVKRDGNLGDAYGYDKADQAMAVQLNITNPDASGAAGPQTIVYDANGNRTTFSAYGPTDTYTVNDLSQYTARNSSQAVYDNNGNMTTGLDGSAYTYDAQNRLLTASKGSTTDTFLYDGLNRQIGKQIGSAPMYYRVYDGWDLLGEYKTGTSNAFWAYLYGATGVVKNLVTNNYYYQDASGSTSHLADNTGALIEWYRYDLHGTPIVYAANGNVRTGGSNYGIRHLFTGQQWYTELGLYDLRNRYYSPDIGRFLQADPISFIADPSNLYRYCGNEPTQRSDPQGLYYFTVVQNGNNVSIDIPISFSGPAATSAVINSFVNGIQNYLSGNNIGPYNVTTTVTVVPSGTIASLSSNSITVLPGAGTFVTSTDGSGTWYAQGTTDGDTPEYAAAHDAGHLLELGFPENYTNPDRVSQPGYENDIMGGSINGGKLSPKDVNNILARSKAGLFRKFLWKWGQFGPGFLGSPGLNSNGGANFLGGGNDPSLLSGVPFEDDFYADTAGQVTIGTAGGPITYTVTDKVEEH